MEASTETAVEREIAIAASPETIWELLVDPEKATRWMGESASFDPRPGAPDHAVQLRAVRSDHREGRPPDAALGRLTPPEGGDGPNYQLT